MKLLLIAYDRNLQKAVQQQVPSDTDIVNAHDIEGVLNALSSHQFDYVISEYLIKDIDVVRLSNLIRPYQYQVLVDEGTFYDEFDIPPLVAKEFRLVPLSLTDIYKVINHQKKFSPNFKPSLLVIEDDPDSVEIVKRSLDGIYQIEAVYDGETGIKQWLSERHDIVLLDMMLPGIKGIQVLNTILQEDLEQPIIVVTGYGSEQEQRQYFSYGASDVLSKPFRQSELHEVCQRIHRQASCKHLNDYYQNQLKWISEQMFLMEYHWKRHEHASIGRLIKEIMEFTPMKLIPSPDDLNDLLQEETERKKPSLDRPSFLS